MRTLHGDLLKSNERLIAHGCNSQGVMGSGIAKQIKLRYPEVYEDYKRVYEDYVKKTKIPYLPLGKLFSKETNDGTRVVLNLITQHLFGSNGNKFVSYDAVDECFTHVAEYMELNDHQVIGIPQIGAGLGGGDWNVIASIINSRMSKFDVNVYVL